METQPAPTKPGRPRQFGRTWNPKTPRDSIQRIVGKFHVSTSTMKSDPRFSGAWTCNACAILWAGLLRSFNKTLREQGCPGIPELPEITN